MATQARGVDYLGRVATATSKPEPKQPTVAQLVDELGAIEQQLEPHRPAMLREDKLRAEIRAHFAEKPADQPFEAIGAKFSALVGACGLKSIIDNRRAFKLLGQSAFCRVATLTLAALEREKVDLTGIISKEQTGTRSLRVFRRA